MTTEKSPMFPRLCQDEHFWELDGLLSNTCFQNTILTWIPTAWLLISLLFYIPYLKGRKGTRKPFSYHTVAKLATTSFLMIVTITYIINNSVTQPKDKLVINIGKGVALFTQTISLVLQSVEWKKRVYTSAVNFIFWFLALFDDIVWLAGAKELSTIDMVLVTLSLCFKLVLFLLFCFTERSSKKCHPYKRASFLSRLTFFWMTSVMRKGCRQNVRDNFVPSLMEQDTTSYIHLKYKATEKHLKTKDRHWFSVLVRMFWKDLFLIQLIRGMYDILVFLNPILLNYFLKFLNSEESSLQWMGYVYSISFLFINISMSITDQAVYWRSGRLGLNVKTAIVDLIYRKLLRNRGEVLEDVSIENFISIDADIFRETITYLWVILSAPLQIFICIIILFCYVGYTALFCSLIIPMYVVVWYCLQRIGKLQEKYMREKDNRRGLMKEIMDTIKIIKFSALESVFLKKLQDIRNKELNFLKKLLLWESFIATTSEVLPFLVTLLMCISLYFIKGKEYLSTENFFLMFMATSILETNFVIFPDVVTDCTKARESYKRIDQYLNSPNKNFDMENCDDFAVVMENASFADGKLQNINLAVKPGELIVVCGKSGSGKSLLLRSMSSCIPKTSGSFLRKRKVAYAPQNPWIMSGTIKDNIIFGKIFNEKRFNQAVKYSALQEDLNGMDENAESKVIDEGMNLSGGQRSRINLARTVYSRPDVFLLDDQLASLDPTSTHYIINNLFGKRGLLKEITRIIVTEPSSEWLSEADQVVVMDDGQIAEKGNFSDIKDTAKFRELLSMHHSDDQVDGASPLLLTQTRGHSLFQKSQRKSWSSIRKRLNPNTSRGSHIISMPLRQSYYCKNGSFMDKKISSCHFKTGLNSSYRSFSRDLSRRKYMEAASMRVSIVEVDDSLRNYELRPREFRKYLKIVGVCSMLISALMAGIYQTSKVVSGLKLEVWTRTNYTTNAQSDKELFGYGFFGLTQALWLGLFYMTTTVFAIRTNKKVHLKMIEHLLYCPLSFFLETSKFDVEYHFFNNLGEVDEELQDNYKMWANAFFDILATFVLISTEMLYCLPVIIFLNIIIWAEMKVYTPAVIKMQQMCNQCASDLLLHIGQTEHGGDVIAAFSNESSFIMKNNLCVDQQHRYCHSVVTAKRWSAFILQLFGCIIIFLVCLVATISKESIAVGLILTYLIKVSKSLDWFVRMTSDIVVMKISVQELNFHMGLKKENINSAGKPFQKLPENWPERGEIEFLDFSAKYEMENTCCLTSIDLHIKPGEKIGIIGKSGSGKSSLIMALARMVSHIHGILSIDGQNIFEVDPQELRSKLLIFPQECELFSGSLRTNLDPYNKFTDQELHDVMAITRLNLDLEKDYSRIAEISCGTKQLIYLTKCLLKKSKVVILDEATANVSVKQSREIMSIVEENFQDSTILCIAHKLDIVQNYDKILVMEKGENVEFGPPEKLLKQKNSYYYNMVLLSKTSSSHDTIYE